MRTSPVLCSSVPASGTGLGSLRLEVNPRLPQPPRALPGGEGRPPAAAGSACGDSLVSLFVEQGLYYEKRTALNEHKRLMRNKTTNSSVSHLR